MGVGPEIKTQVWAKMGTRHRLHPMMYCHGIVIFLPSHCMIVLAGYRYDRPVLSGTEAVIRGVTGNFAQKRNDTTNPRNTHVC